MKYYTEKREKEYLVPEGIVMKLGEIREECFLLTNRDKQNIMGKDGACVVEGKGTLVFDFEKEYYGGVRIVLGCCETDSAAPNIRIRFGESLSECCAELGEKNASNDHSTRDMTVYMSSKSDMEWGNTGYRYIRIDFLEKGIYRINNIFGTFIHGKYPDALFETDNETVNKILNMSERTLFLNIQNYLWDGIKRDQHVWVGDLYPEVLGFCYLYRDKSVIYDTLDLILDSYPLPCWFNGIPSYNLWFILIVGICYRLTGRKNERYSAAVRKIVWMFDKCTDEHGIFDFDKAGLAYWKDNFFDWPTYNYEQESEQGVYYLLLYALADVTGKEFYGEETRAEAQRLTAKLRRRKYAESKFKSVSALKVLCGEANGQRETMFIKEGGAKGYSSFLSYLISLALSKTGDTRTAFDNLVEYYGGMLQMGATTCWENFDVTWMENACKITEFPSKGKEDIHGDRGEFCYRGFRNSLCHGWSCGFLPFFVEKVVGFQFTNAECTKIAFTPEMCGLSYIKARIPTEKGIVQVEHRWIDGAVHTKYVLPQGIECVSDRMNIGIGLEKRAKVV